ncbi:MAG: di-trans,poly-cis-decaprenylcistransferase [Clostridia bacterium]|nr:di-trans,poly-cis-decaprenylcistransferase [Clostridia bacterium]
MKQVVADAHLQHIAFIMDGNGRWAQKRGLPREAGHKVGVEAFRKVGNKCKEYGIKTITIYAFSTENWSRPKNEVTEIMRLLDKYIAEARDENEINRSRYYVLGDKERLGPELKAKCIELEEFTKDNKIDLNIALNYGGRDEIVRAVNRLIAEGKTEITEEDISSHLFTSHSPDPDLIVRSGGEYRLSNFLMWQSAYSELYFTDCLWPDFDDMELRRAIVEFSKRKRRFGGV